MRIANLKPGTLLVFVLRTRTASQFDYGDEQTDYADKSGMLVFQYLNFEFICYLRFGICTPVIQHRTLNLQAIRFQHLNPNRGTILV